jgi:uncharacterized protein YneF (UPF0154 family)
MEVAAAFLIVIVFIVVGVLGGALYLVAMRLRGRQLDPEEDKVEQPAGRAGHQQEGRPRPEHVEVESEQRTRFAGSR